MRMASVSHRAFIIELSREVTCRVPPPWRASSVYSQSVCSQSVCSQSAALTHHLVAGLHRRVIGSSSWRRSSEHSSSRASRRVSPACGISSRTIISAAGRDRLPRGAHGGFRQSFAGTRPTHPHSGRSLTSGCGVIRVSAVEVQVCQHRRYGKRKSAISYRCLGFLGFARDAPQRRTIIFQLNLYVNHYRTDSRLRLRGEWSFLFEAASLVSRNNRQDAFRRILVREVNEFCGESRGVATCVEGWGVIAAKAPLRLFKGDSYAARTGVGGSVRPNPQRPRPVQVIDPCHPLH